MKKILRYLFFFLLVRPLVFFLLGVSVHFRSRLPLTGPAIIVANHNSHLDTLILMSLFPLHMLPKIRPVAAADYFLRNRLLAWFFKNIIGIIPIERTRSSPLDDPLEPVSNALLEQNIVIFYPEGTRGEPEHLTKFKSGIAHLAEKHPDIPIVPIFLHGTGKALPKGEALLVPFVIDIQVAESIVWNGDKRVFIDSLEQILNRLSDSVKQRILA